MRAHLGTLKEFESLKKYCLRKDPNSIISNVGTKILKSHVHFVEVVWPVIKSIRLKSKFKTDNLFQLIPLNKFVRVFWCKKPLLVLDFVKAITNMSKLEIKKN